MSLKISQEQFDAIRQVESGGRPDAVGDQGRSIGPYQIQEGYWKDAVEHNPSLKDGGKTWQNTKGAGSIEYSERVMQSYADRYATKSRLGRDPTFEDVARNHNGGPNGYKRSSTDAYWQKVKETLQK